MLTLLCLTPSMLMNITRYVKHTVGAEKEKAVQRVADAAQPPKAGSLAAAVARGEAVECPTCRVCNMILCRVPYSTVVLSHVWCSQLTLWCSQLTLWCSQREHTEQSQCSAVLCKLKKVTLTRGVDDVITLPGTHRRGWAAA